MLPPPPSSLLPSADHKTNGYFDKLLQFYCMQNIQPSNLLPPTPLHPPFLSLSSNFPSFSLVTVFEVYIFGLFKQTLHIA